MRIFSLLSIAAMLIGSPVVLLAQFHNGFPYGKITYAELDLTVYPNDTSANAVVLNEFGEAYIENGGNYNLLFEHHFKIKILKKGGLDEGDFKIYLGKNKDIKQTVRYVEGVTYNFENGKIKESKLQKTSMFDEVFNEYADFKKFTMPDVKVGSVIEVRYMVESPFIFNFWPWKFQSDLPKKYSEFWARIPAIYDYNISLQGFLKLTKNDVSLQRECFQAGAFYKSDCSFHKYAIENVPAFINEDFMTSRENFISAINFELTQVHGSNGVTKKYTQTWPDVDASLRLHENFGNQIKKAANIFEDKIAALTSIEKDPLKKAKLIYSYIQSFYEWNENYSKYTEDGVKVASEKRIGNSSEINLSLVAALQSAGLNADPVILATRQQKPPSELYPVVSDFNYVIAHVEIGNQKFLLDGTSNLLPFGVIPERCFNGRGRLVSKNKDESRWVDILPIEKQKKKITFLMKMDKDGGLKGEASVISYGYEAYDKRNAILNKGKDVYIKEFQDKMNEAIISDYTIKNLDSIESPLTEKYKIEINAEVASASTIFLNPFLLDRWKTNSLKSPDRLYPVDFGAPLETSYYFVLDYPAEYMLDEFPKNAALALPQNGGKYIFSLTNMNNKITMINNLNLTKGVYLSDEYPALRELFNMVVQLHQTQLVLKKK
ncbi:MAG: DUF3857 domain-containing protein [Cyclobacteriaceae bacterium]|nr:DUF3857 domain-containing protein [Cyclobacteriaceae bacterium]